MEEMANGLTIGQISQPFRTQFGWHLLEVLDRRTRNINDETLRQRALAALRQRKVEQETERWSRQLRDESFVEVRS
jgi:peptidyl-prolyl cis-trans isomerase SurA